MSSPDPHHKNLLASLSATPLDEAIPGDLLTSVLSAPPFVTAVPGTLNLRDVGASAPAHVAPGRAFRSGTLDFVPAPHLPSLRSRLGVSRVYDFRRDDEVRAGRLEIDGVHVLACPYKDGKEMPASVVVSDFAPAGDGGVPGRGYPNMYDDILGGYTTGFRLVFEGLRDAEKGEAVLFHCTAGKDRTGVISALILDLMGVPAEQIGLEYALTRIGTEPFREKLLPAALKSFGANPTEGVDLSRPGMRELLGTRAEVMVDFVGHLQREYGGAQGYLADRLGFSEDEVGQIREKLRPKTGGEDA